MVWHRVRSTQIHVWYHTVWNFCIDCPVLMWIKGIFRNRRICWKLSSLFSVWKLDHHISIDGKDIRVLQFCKKVQDYCLPRRQITRNFNVVTILSASRYFALEQRVEHGRWFGMPWRSCDVIIMSSCEWRCLLSNMILKHDYLTKVRLRSFTLI